VAIGRRRCAVEILARAKAEGEPAVGQQLHGCRLLRDDGGVIRRIGQVAYVIKGM